MLEIEELEGRGGIPSEIKLLGQDDGTEGRDDDHAQWIEGRDEHGAPRLHHDALHVVRDSGADYALSHDIRRSKLV